MNTAAGAGVLMIQKAPRTWKVIDAIINGKLECENCCTKLLVAQASSDKLSTHWSFVPMVLEPRSESQRCADADLQTFWIRGLTRIDPRWSILFPRITWSINISKLYHLSLYPKSAYAVKFSFTYRWVLILAVYSASNERVFSRVSRLLEKIINWLT